jgi:molybdopterin adenylyltransferase
MSAQNIKVLSVNISEKTGTIKNPVKEIVLNHTGIINDAHSGNWHRQVSLLGIESINKFTDNTGKKIQFGEFAENITTEGLILYETNPLDKFIIGNSELEITQIGKKCHTNNCAIYRQTNDCIMPKEGIFCRVIKGGRIKAGDKIIYLPKIYKVKVITLSDRASRGEYEDMSGKKIKEMLLSFFGNKPNEIDSGIIPDDKEQLSAILTECKKHNFDFIFTTGGTGISERDITPDIVSGFLDKQIPGIMDSIRLKFGANNPNALLSRSIAGVMNNSLVFTLPGSVRAVDEYMTEIFRVLNHLVYMLHNLDIHG